jgi:hypothetical protein
LRGWGSFVEQGEKRALDVGVTEIADEQDSGDTNEEDERHGGRVGQRWSDEAGDQVENEDVREIDGVGPVADGGEEGEITNEAGAFEFHGSEEEERGEGAVEEGAAPGAVDDPLGVAGEDDCGETKERGGEEQDAGGGVQARTTVDVEEETASEEFEYGGTEEELDYGIRGEADVELQRDYGETPETEKPWGEAFWGYKEEEKEDEVEVELVAEGPTLQQNHREVGGDEEVGSDDVEAGDSPMGEEVRQQSEGGVDPEDGKDAGEAMIEEDTGVGAATEFSCGNGGDDDAADDEEEIDAEIAVTEETEIVDGEVLRFNTVDMSENDDESGKSATDLDADDSPGLLLKDGGHYAAPVALLYQRLAEEGREEPDRE